MYIQDANPVMYNRTYKYVKDFRMEMKTLEGWWWLHMPLITYFWGRGRQITVRVRFTSTKQVPGQPGLLTHTPPMKNSNHHSSSSTVACFTASPVDQDWALPQESCFLCKTESHVSPAATSWVSILVDETRQHCHMTLFLLKDPWAHGEVHWAPCWSEWVPVMRDAQLSLQTSQDCTPHSFERVLGT